MSERARELEMELMEAESLGVSLPFPLLPLISLKQRLGRWTRGAGWLLRGSRLFHLRDDSCLTCPGQPQDPRRSQRTLSPCRMLPNNAAHLSSVSATDGLTRTTCCLSPSLSPSLTFSLSLSPYHQRLLFRLVQFGTDEFVLFSRQTGFLVLSS